MGCFQLAKIGTNVSVLSKRSSVKKTLERQRDPCIRYQRLSWNVYLGALHRAFLRTRLPLTQATVICLLDWNIRQINWSTNIPAQTGSPPSRSNELDWYFENTNVIVPSFNQKLFLGFPFSEDKYQISLLELHDPTPVYFFRVFGVSPLTPHTPRRPLWSSFCPSSAFCFLPLKTFEYAFPFIWKPLQPFLPPQNDSFCSVFLCQLKYKYL